MAKRLNPNLAKIHRNYTVEEAGHLFSVHKNTVRSWLKDGLIVNDNKRPTLILGSELRVYLQSRRSKNKQKCKPSELYCLRCRSPQLPAGNMVDYEPVNCRSGRLIALCSTCGGIINKYFSIANLWQIQEKLDITLPKALKHNKRECYSPLKQ